MRQPIPEPLLQTADSLWLIAGGLKGGMQFEGFAHDSLPHYAAAMRRQKKTAPRGAGLLCEPAILLDIYPA
ncbi:aldehyde dehydrogenase [Edwardsiella piscicida]|nr:aldehyde dehydrogenase [Edwardsiella piscicida]